MKATLVAAALFAAGTACADRLIQMPTGKKIPFRVVEVERYWDKDDPEFGQIYLGLGIGPAFDTELVLDKGPGREDRLIMDLSYNYVEPFLRNPGLSMGIRDIFNNSVWGRSLYIAGTAYQLTAGEFNSESPFEFTLGLQAGTRRSGLYVSTVIPFFNFFKGVVEYDLDEPTGGFEIRPSRTMTVRWLHRAKRSMLSVNLAQKF